MQYSPYLTLLTLGLVSSFHCVGMCGGIMGALGLSTPVSARARPLHFLAYVLFYNLGRVSSYAAAGGLLWLAESLLPESLSFAAGHFVLRLLGAVVMLAAGLHLAGWFPDFKRFDVLGRPLWARLEPLARKLLPVKSLPMALAYGAVWGWLPCGLVYTALLYALSQAAQANPAVMMAAFGLGTLPMMLATGLMLHSVTGLARSPRFRQAAGVLICILALASVLFVPPNHSQHLPLHAEPASGAMPYHHH